MADAFISRHQLEKSQHFPDPEGAAIDGDCLSYKGQFSKKVSGAASVEERREDTLLLWCGGLDTKAIADELCIKEVEAWDYVQQFLDAKYKLNDTRRMA